ncbi:MAG: hypothetical protein PGN13_01080 [Patulibacter minatonensis]
MTANTARLTRAMMLTSGATLLALGTVATQAQAKGYEVALKADFKSTFASNIDPASACGGAIMRWTETTTLGLSGTTKMSIRPGSFTSLAFTARIDSPSRVATQAPTGQTLPATGACDPAAPVIVPSPSALPQLQVKDLSLKLLAVKGQLVLTQVVAKQLYGPGTLSVDLLPQDGVPLDDADGVKTKFALSKLNALGKKKVLRYSTTFRLAGTSIAGLTGAKLVPTDIAYEIPLSLDIKRTS